MGTTGRLRDGSAITGESEGGETMAKRKGEEPKTFAYEEFMAQARKEGRVRNETLSMKVLKPDLSLQARVNHLDVDHVRALHDILKGGQQLAPIVVFEVEQPKGKAFKIADGFHRHEVYRREKAPGIPCIVVTGTMQEAIEYAASANQALSLPRTKDDAKKAVFMLFANGWLGKSARLIHLQTGVSTGSVERYRLEYCKAEGMDRPRLVEYSDGRVNARRSAGGNKAKEAESRRIVRLLSHGSSLASWLLPRGVRLIGKQDGFHIGVYAASNYAVACLKIDPGSAGPTVAAEAMLLGMGKALFAKSCFGKTKPVVLVPSPLNAFGEIVEIARSLGVEFMTLDEFVAAMKADAERKAV